MKRFKKVIISASLCVVAGVSMALVLESPAQSSSSPPKNAAEAISAALERDSEMADLKIKERYAYGNLYRVRLNSNDQQDLYQNTMATFENVSELHSIWARMDMRTGKVTAEVLGSITAIGTEVTKQDELSKLLDNMARWIETAENEYRTSRIDHSVLSSLRESRIQVQNSHKAGDLRLQVLRDRFRTLTGSDISDDFDYDSAWLLVDVDRVDSSLVSGPKPSMVFRKNDNIITPPGEETSAETLISYARLALISLHEALLNYEKLDKLVIRLEDMYKKGEIDKYVYYDAIHGRTLSCMSVYDAKNAYATSLLELDRYSGGLISSQYRGQSAEWFSDDEGALWGRKNVKGAKDGGYVWMSNIDGEWELENAAGDDGQVALTVSSPWYEKIGPKRVALYYNDELLASGRMKEKMTFPQPKLLYTSLIKAVFYDDNGYELNYAYLDGFANTGRFFSAEFETKLGTPVITATEIRDNNNLLTGVKLSWQPVAYADTFLAHYLVEYSETGDDDDFDTVTTTRSTEVTLNLEEDLLNHNTVYFRVTAISSDPERWDDSNPSNKEHVNNAAVPPSWLTSSLDPFPIPEITPTPEPPPPIPDPLPPFEP